MIDICDSCGFEDDVLAVGPDDGAGGMVWVANVCKDELACHVRCLAISSLHDIWTEPPYPLPTGISYGGERYPNLNATAIVVDFKHGRRIESRLSILGRRGGQLHTARTFVEPKTPDWAEDLLTEYGTDTREIPF